jgi:hypothetical protein
VDKYSGTAARLIRKILPNNLKCSGPYDISSSGATDVLGSLLIYLNNLNSQPYLGDAETQLQGLVEDRQNIQVQLASEQGGNLDPRDVSSPLHQDYVMDQASLQQRRQGDPAMGPGTRWMCMECSVINSRDMLACANCQVTSPDDSGADDEETMDLT